MSGIVVGIDGSHNASHALEWAMAEAAIRNTQLTVLTVHSVPASYWTGNPWPLPGYEEKVAEIRKAAEAAVAATAAKAGSSQPGSVTVNAVIGFPAQALIDASRDTDLLVVGTRGGGGFGSLVLGSVSSQVVHHASCPVVVVPAGK
jgi:nucleotide-binding universal stress UspA family protein